MDGVDLNTEANVGSTVIELPTSEINPKPEMHIGGGAVCDATASCFTSIAPAIQA